MKYLLASALLAVSLSASAADVPIQQNMFMNDSGSSIAFICDGHNTPTTVIRIPGIVTQAKSAILSIDLSGYYQTGEPRNVFFTASVSKQRNTTVITAITEGDNLGNMLKTEYVAVTIVADGYTDTLMFDFNSIQSKLSRAAASCGIH